MESIPKRPPPPPAPAPQGISTPENCLPEFPTDGNEASYLPWDVIPMPARYLTGQPSVKARADCQVACASNPACQYFVWYDYTGGVDPQSTDQCFLRVGPQAIAPLNFSSSGVVNAIGFEVRACSGRLVAGRFALSVCRWTLLDVALKRVSRVGL